VPRRFSDPALPAILLYAPRLWPFGALLSAVVLALVPNTARIATEMAAHSRQWEPPQAQAQEWM
jgi:hypothetical protein